MNDVKTDNRIANLVWGTKAENTADAMRNGRNPRGESHGCAKLSEVDVLAIRQRRSDGDTYASIGDSYGVTLQNIYAICKRKTWRRI